MSEAVATYCANHPDRETGLRCNRCGKYICSQCAVRTPTGYRCQECVRGQQKKFETAKTFDYIIGFIVAAFLSGLGGWLASVIGFFTILLAPAAGGVIAEVVRAATGGGALRCFFASLWLVSFLERRHLSYCLYYFCLTAEVLGYCYRFYGRCCTSRSPPRLLITACPASR